LPRPAIEANWDGTFSIKVIDDITRLEEATAFHWHSILHRETPGVDGVPLVHQRPIKPGASFTYSF
ncbi:hypothetical protein BJ878DRAFT_386747, partial [Calycina marina]